THRVLAAGQSFQALALAALAAGCGTGAAAQRPTPPIDPNAPVERIEMDPIKIEARKPAEGGPVELESFDAADLFEQGGAALSAQKWDDAIHSYERLVVSFKDSRWTKAALYNMGLAHQGKKDWPAAAARFKELADGYPDSAESKDALFQLGATYA